MRLSARYTDLAISRPTSSWAFDITTEARRRDTQTVAVYFFYDDAESAPFYYLTPSRSVGPLPPPYDSPMTPEAYLEYAIDDFKTNSPRARVNAFGHVKRAVHLAVDQLLNQYGLFVHYKKANFPTRLRLLDEVGLVPRTIIENLNIERNAVEHEYAVPTERRVAEAIDVAKLLLMATEGMLERTLHEVVVGWKSNRRHFVIQLDPLIGEVRLFGIHAKGLTSRINGRLCFSGTLRHFLTEKVSPRVRLSKKPWRSIRLDQNATDVWRPILVGLVTFNDASPGPDRSSTERRLQLRFRSPFPFPH